MWLAIGCGIGRPRLFQASSTGMNLGKAQAAEALRNSGLDENVRAEKLTMDELALLCENL